MSVTAQNTSFNSTNNKNKQPHCIDHPIQQCQDWVNSKLKDIFKYHSQIALTWATNVCS